MIQKHKILIATIIGCLIGTLVATTCVAQCDDSAYQQYLSMLNRSMSRSLYGQHNLKMGGNRCDIIVWVMPPTDFSDIAVMSDSQLTSYIRRQLGADSINTLRGYMIRRIVFMPTMGTFTVTINL